MSRYIDTDKLKVVFMPIQETDYSKGWNDAVKAVMENAETEDVAPVVRAKWIKLRYQMYTCSRCKRSVYLEGLNVTDENETKLLRELYSYCNCGAKMDETKEEAKGSENK